jgi:mycofactocin precursor peptide peptidase
VILVNGHGGNVDAIRSAATALRDEGRGVLVWSPSIPLGDAHAGRTETSLLLAIDSSVVDLDRAEPGATAPIAELLPTLRAHGVRSVSANGVLGDPTGASVTEGRLLLGSLVLSLATLVDR